MHDLRLSAGPATLPFSRGYASGAPLTWWRGLPITQQVFDAHVAALANRLPDSGLVLNLCEDRAAFVLGWAAALSRGLTTVLPSDRTPRGIAQAAADSGASRLLHDQRVGEPLSNALPTLRIGFDAVVRATDYPPLAVAAEQVAAIVYTSGSTGKPTACAKRWGSLVSGARTLGGMLGWHLPQAGSVIGAVAPQHMFGLETTVMLPLQWGVCIRPERPLLPADITSVLVSAEAPAWLMITPLHAQACLAAGLERDVNNPAGVISSTMPLTSKTASALEHLWGTCVWEIYGSSETGMVGLRRTSHAAAWRLVDDLELTVSDGTAVVSGRACMPAQRLHDDLRALGDDRFLLVGRNRDIVKVGGKRASLVELNAVLCNLDGVREAVFVQPQEGGRLVALVVAESGLGKRQIEEFLACHFDPVFLPRPVWLVDRLPRNENGKLPRAALLDLINQLRDK